MTPFQHSILTYALNAVFQVPVVALAGWIVCSLCRSLGPLFVHKLWVVTLLFAVVTPFSSTLSPQSIITSASATHTARMVAADASSQPYRLLQHGTVTLSAFWLRALLFVFLAGVLLFALRLLVGWLRTRRLVKDSFPVALNEAQNQVWQRCRSLFGVGRIELQYCSLIEAPAVLGLRKPLLLLPCDFLTNTSDDELAAALGQECAHVLRHDYACNLFYQSIAIAIGWHPATWFIKAQLEQSREMVCDALVVERVLPSVSYATSLLRLASRLPAHTRLSPVHTVGIFDANILEKRVMNLRNKKPVVSTLKQLGIYTLALIIAAAGAVSALATTLDLAQQSQPSSSGDDARIYKVGGDVSAPQLIHAVDPEFPPNSHQPDGFEGVCIVKLIVNKQGKPQDISVVRSLSPAFDASAIQAVKQYRFKPAMRNNKPVAVSINIETNFKKY
jgi:TonB family protein